MALLRYAAPAAQRLLLLWRWNCLLRVRHCRPCAFDRLPGLGRVSGPSQGYHVRIHLCWAAAPIPQTSLLLKRERGTLHVGGRVSPIEQDQWVVDFACVSIGRLASFDHWFQEQLQLDFNTGLNCAIASFQFCTETQFVSRICFVEF